MHLPSDLLCGLSATQASLVGASGDFNTTDSKSYPPTPSLSDLSAARAMFETREPRDLFYRAATELVDLAIHNKTKISVAEALAVLLLTWNMALYRFHPFDAQHFADIESILATHDATLAHYRDQRIESYSGKDQEVVGRVFHDFEQILGPVGAAKCLHLLAPRFSPIWDRAIAFAYGVTLQKRGANARHYTDFIEMTKRQVIAFGSEQAIGRNPLKALDEFNYCKYTKAWL